MQHAITREGVDEIATVREIVRRLGRQSTEAQVVAEYNRQDAEGLKPVCLSHAGTWLVTPFRRYLEGVVATLNDVARSQRPANQPPQAG